LEKLNLNATAKPKAAYLSLMTSNDYERQQFTNHRITFLLLKKNISLDNKIREFYMFIACSKNMVRVDVTSRGVLFIFFLVQFSISLGAFLIKILF